MPVRRIVLASTVFVLAFVLIGGAAAKKPAPPPPPPPPSEGPSAPTNLQLTVNGPYSITLTWTAAKSGSTNWWYCIQRDGVGCIRVDPPTTTFMFSRLWPGTTFNYSVVAIESSGKRSAPSNTVTYSTPPDTTPPSAPEVSLTASGRCGSPAAGRGRSTTRARSGTRSSSTASTTARTRSATSRHSSSTHTVHDVQPPGHGARPLREHEPEQRRDRDDTAGRRDDAADDADEPAPVAADLLAGDLVEWDQSTDDTDPQSQILYDVYVNGVPEHLAIGYGDELVYCHTTGENRFTLQAVDTSGNASGHSNEIVFILG